MKYQCARCNEIFTHTAKQIDQSSFMLAKLDGTTEKVLGPTGTYSKLIVETAVCPFCHNIKFAEYVEPEAVTLVKPKKKDTPQQSEDKFTVQAKEYYSMLHPEGQP
jgi:hypothetical protein